MGFQVDMPQEKQTVIDEYFGEIEVAVKAEETHISLGYTPTEEQQFAVNVAKSEKIMKVNAIAGSGKTATLVYIAGALQVPSLYMAFNKSMADEASSKFPSHVDCMTTHSLAYRHVGKHYRDKLSRPRGRGYVNVAGTGSEIARFFRIKDFDLDECNYIPKGFLGTVIKDTVGRFEMSAADEITIKHIPKVHVDEFKTKLGDRGRSALDALLKATLNASQDLWEERIDKKSIVLCTHNTYLKLYQLSKPNLSKYEVIYLDEAQDGNSVTMSIIMNQKHDCKLIFVGDKFQQIYSWNGSVNTLQNIDCPAAKLTKSFRYGAPIAEVARYVLKDEVEITGNDNVESSVSYEGAVIDYNKPYTFLFRTNMELVLNAVRLISEGESVAVNVDLKDLTAKMRSAQSLSVNNMKGVKHPDVLPYTSWEEYESEAKTDPEIKRITRLINSGDDVEMMEMLDGYRNPKNPHITMTTAHKSKGMEYSQVVLADDFPSNFDDDGIFVGVTQEETNLLYVAVTRALHKLQYNTSVKECLEYYKDGVKKVSVEEEAKIETAFRKAITGEIAEMEPRGDMANFILQQELDDSY